MSNRPQRVEAMNHSLVIRVSPTDKQNLSLEANRQGISVSNLVRQTLIEKRILNPINLV